MLWLCCSCRGAVPEAEPVPLAVQVAHATRMDLEETLTTSGPLTPPPGADVKLGALLPGRLAAVLVAEGDRVTRGQVLARIEATAFRDALSQARAQLAQARSQGTNSDVRLERAEKLFAAGVAARQEVDDAQTQAAASHAALQGAAASVSTAENQLGRAELRAPFDGVVAHVFASAGEPVDGTGKPLLEVAQTGTLEVRGVVSVADAQQLSPGLSAQVSLRSVRRSWPGEVIAVSPLLDAASGTATVRVRVANPDGTLKGGEVADARILLATHKNALAIPASAVLPANGAESPPHIEARVETIDAQGKALSAEVKLGIRAGTRVEVLDGLQEGARVIVQGAYALPEGTPVRAGAGAP